MRGYKLLTWKETSGFLNSFNAKYSPRHALVLSQTNNAGNPEAILFQPREIFAEAVYVWKYEGDKKNGHLSRYGSVIINGNVLCTDSSLQSFFKDIWKPDTRPAKHVAAMIALFSQWQDGILYGGYYDFIFCLAAKLCRIKDAFPNENFSNWHISYPMFGTRYENEILELLGIEKNKVVDSREYKLISPQILLANEPSWYPNKEDIFSLKRHIFEKINPLKKSAERIYISRSGRRKVINESELIAVLRKYDFTIIEDKPRSVSEQVSIYYNASFIIGPHGASFSNIIWCRPGTHLMELFSPNYAPDFFLYLATITGVSYSAIYEGERDPSIIHGQGLEDDIYISIPKLEAYLTEKLNV